MELKTNPELSFAIVPDITAPDVYEEAIKDVSYAVHIASPLASSVEGDNYEATIIQPAVQGTLAMLEAAKKSGTVKRVVITSSWALMNQEVHDAVPQRDGTASATPSDKSQAQTAPVSASPEPTFFRLPRELRDAIYESAYGPDGEGTTKISSLAARMDTERAQRRRNTGAHSVSCDCSSQPLMCFS